MKCGQHDCNRPALVRYVWPGAGRLYICGRCVPWMLKISEAMGLNTEIEALEVFVKDTICLFPWELEELGEYSCSLPTGTTIGKRWKRDMLAYVPKTESHLIENTERALAGEKPLKIWTVGEYVEHPDPDTVGIKWYQVEILEGPREGWA